MRRIEKQRDLAKHVKRCIGIGSYSEQPTSKWATEIHTFTIITKSKRIHVMSEKEKDCFMINYISLVHVMFTDVILRVGCWQMRQTEMVNHILDDCRYWWKDIWALVFCIFRLPLSCTIHSIHEHRQWLNISLHFFGQNDAYLQQRFS